MSGYTKLFNSILASTIWREDDKTRIVWITLLAMADRYGVAEGSVPGLADFARVSVDDCRAALEKLMAPDSDSRSHEFEGRRIAKVDGGWQILNHQKYRMKMSADDRREYFRTKKAEQRSKKSTNVKDMSLTVLDIRDKSTMSTHAEAEAEAEAEAVRGSIPLNPSDALNAEIEAIYQAYPLKVGKPAALRAIKKALSSLEASVLLEKVRHFARVRPPGTPFTPHPATWFNQCRFNDEPSTWARQDEPAPKSEIYPPLRAKEL